MLFGKLCTCIATESLKDDSNCEEFYTPKSLW
jgi:hypothetical protein